MRVTIIGETSQDHSIYYYYEINKIENDTWIDTASLNKIFYIGIIINFNI